MRFLAQRDQSSCSIIACINILKLLGIKRYKGLRAAEKDLSKWRKHFNCKPSLGANPSKIIKWYQSLPTLIKFFPAPYKFTIKKIDNILKKHYLVINWCYNENNNLYWHASIIVHKKNKKYLILNDGSLDNMKYITQTTLKDMLEVYLFGYALCLNWGIAVKRLKN